MRRGFTLLEVMIALAILAVSLTILIGTQANSVHMTERASRMSSAAMLARSQMIDIEHELLSEGFSDMTEEMRGDFRDDGFDGMEWNAVVEVVELPPEASERTAKGDIGLSTIKGLDSRALTTPGLPFTNLRGGK
jgi:general secretion pathway protein I